MRAAPILAVLLVLAPLAGGEDTSPPPGLLSAHVELRSDVSHRKLLDKLTERLERALAIFEKHLPGLSLPEGKRLVLNLHATREGYAAACREQGCPQMADRSGFTAIQGESHLVLEPRSEPEYLALVGDLPEATELLACHEALHQWLAATGGAPEDGLLPAWYCEGMAEHVSALCLDARAVHVAEKPEAALEALAARRSVSLERLLHADLATFDRKALLYSLASSFYAVLAAEPGKLERLHAAIRAIEHPEGDFPAARFGERCIEALARIYGPLDALEARWKASLAQASVEWFEDGACSQLAGEEIVCAGTPSQSAILVSGRPPRLEHGDGPVFELSCELELMGLGNGAAEIYLGYEGRADRRYVKLALPGSAGPRDALLDAFTDGYFQPRWKRSSPLDPEAVVPRRWTRVAVTADRRTIRLRVEGKDVLEADAPPGFSILGGRWGLGARDEVVRFRHVRGP